MAKYLQEQFVIEDFKRYMKLSAQKKLELLEQINAFFAKAMPIKSKKAWEELKKRGF